MQYDGEAWFVPYASRVEITRANGGNKLKMLRAPKGNKKDGGGFYTRRQRWDFWGENERGKNRDGSVVAGPGGRLTGSTARSSSSSAARGSGQGAPLGTFDQL